MNLGVLLIFVDNFPSASEGMLRVLLLAEVMMIVILACQQSGFLRFLKTSPRTSTFVSVSVCVLALWVLGEIALDISRVAVEDFSFGLDLLILDFGNRIAWVLGALLATAIRWRLHLRVSRLDEDG